MSARYPTAGLPNAFLILKESYPALAPIVSLIYCMSSKNPEIGRNNWVKVTWRNCNILRQIRRGQPGRSVMFGTILNASSD